MVRFTSRLEARLWGAASAVLVAIYTAALLAGSLVAALGSEAVLGIAFAAGLALAALAVVGIALDRGPGIEVWVAVAVAAGWLMVPVRSGVSALERTHLFEYGILAALLYAALAERARNGAGPRFAGMLAVALAGAVGWVDEAIQGLLPTRVYDLRDVAVNVLAAGVAVVVVATVRRLRLRRSPPRSPPPPPRRPE